VGLGIRVLLNEHRHHTVDVGAHGAIFVLALKHSFFGQLHIAQGVRGVTFLLVFVQVFVQVLLGLHLLNFIDVLHKVVYLVFLFIVVVFFCLIQIQSTQTVTDLETLAERGHDEGKCHLG